MEIEEAIQIVSYKLGAKNGVEALDDSILDEETVRQAIQDDENQTVRSIDTKDYLTATRLVNEHRKVQNKSEGEAWLAENARKDDVVTTDSGLQYRVIEAGEGECPGPDSLVEVDYEGTFIDGIPFDSSYERGEPARFPVGGVIQGWKEGLRLMKEGAKFQFFIPQYLAYGERGAGSDIPPYSALIFEVELRSIES